MSTKAKNHAHVARGRSVIALSLACVASVSSCGVDQNSEEADGEVQSSARRTQMLAINEFQVGSNGFVELANGGDVPIDLSGYAIDDGPGGARPLALSGELKQHGVRAFAYAGINSRSEDQVRLLGPGGGVIESHPNGYDTTRWSASEFLTVCQQQVIDWYVQRASWFVAGPCSRDLPNLSIGPSDLVINEIQPGPHGFVELRNAGTRTIAEHELHLLFVEDGPGRSLGTTAGRILPEGVAPGDLLVIEWGGISGTSPEPVQLVGSEGRILDEHDNFMRRGGPAVSGRCFGRQLDLAWAPEAIECTPGAPNFAETTATVVINEFQAGSTGFIELYNAGDRPANLDGWSVDDVERAGGSPRLISGVLEPGAFLSVSYSAINKTSPDVARLVDANGNTVDARETNGAPGNACFGRVPDGGDWRDAPFPRCTPGAPNGFNPAPRGCAASGGNYAGVAFTIREECRALAMLNRARFSELFDIGQVAAETAYFCDATGCGTYRRSNWTSLADFDAAQYGGGTPGPTAFELLRTRSATFVDTGVVQGDTIAWTWEHRDALVPRQLIFERVYIERLYAPWSDGTQCARVTDAPGSANYLRFCAYRTSCHDGSCSGPTPPDLSQHVGSYVWMQGRFNASGSSYNVHNLWLQPTAMRWEANGSGRTVVLEGVSFEPMDLWPEVRALISSTPSYWPTFAAAYRASPAALLATFDTYGGRETLVAAVMWDALGFEPPVERQINVQSVGPSGLGQTLMEMLELHSEGVENPPQVRANYARLGDAMIAEGATHAFTARDEDSGDYSYLSVVVADLGTGDVRILGFRRDP